MKALAALAFICLFFYWSPYILILLFFLSPFLMGLFGIAVMVLMIVMDFETTHVTKG